MPNRPPRRPRPSIARRAALAGRLAVCAAALALATATPARADRALLIGIDDYAYISDLVGSSTDLRNMHAFTRDVWRFAPDEVKVLRDSQATRAAILSGIRDWLIAGSRPGDRVLLYFTGHGSLKPDQNGDEPDGFDEALMAYDTRYDEATRQWQGMVIDDEIGPLVDQLVGREVVILIDACYSGTITRGLDVHPREPQFVKTPHLVEGPAKTRSLTEGVLVRGRPGRSVWSAASSNQEALVDLDAPEKQGVFTRRFTRGVREGLADENGDGRVTQRELYRYIRSESERYCRSRPSYCRTGLTPTLESARDGLDADVATQFAGGGGSGPSTAVASAGGRPSLALDRPDVSDRLREKQSISQWLATRPTPEIPAPPAAADDAPPAPPAATADAASASAADGLVTLLVGRQEVSTTAGDGAAPDQALLALLAPPAADPRPPAGIAPPAPPPAPVAQIAPIPASGAPAATGISAPSAPVPPSAPRPGADASSDLIARLARPAAPTAPSAATPDRPVSQSQLVAMLSLATPTATRSVGGGHRVPLAVVAPDRGTAGGSAVVLQPPADGHVVVFMSRAGEPLRPLTADPRRVTRGTALTLALPGGGGAGGDHILALLTRSRAAADRLLQAARDPAAFLAALDGDALAVEASGTMLVPRD